MKKLLLLLSLIFISLNANAEWKKILHDSSEGTIYYHKDSMEKSGGYTYIWTMTDLAKKSGNNNSYQAFLQVDCGAMKRIKRHNITRYAGNMGTGKVNYSNTTSDEGWQFIPPGSPGYIIFKYAC